MAIKIGITGGIGSGKSVVSRLLDIMGIPVYLSDVEAKRLTQSDEIIKQELIALLGTEIYQDGMLNKPLLASYLFGNTNRATQINAIVHPRVKADFGRWILAHSQDKIVAMESAILIESGFANEVDYIVMVYAPLNLRIKRAVKRDLSTKELITRRIKQQMNDEDKIGYAQFVIKNDDYTPLIPQVIALIERLESKKYS
ncbi:MAG: dephospho-CoA kinase [Bacteroidaceae bacterium]